MIESNLQRRPERPPAQRAAARAAVGSAALLGFAGERLLINGPIGPGFPIWIALLGGSAVLITRQARFAWQLETAVTAAFAVAASVVFATRASEALHAMAFLVIVTMASLPLLRARDFKFGTTPLAPQLLGFAVTAAHAAAGVFLLIGRDVGPRPLPSKRLHGISVATRGALLSLPPLVVFGALFVSADPLFEHYVRGVTRFVSDDLLSHVAIACVFAWIAAGLLRGLLPQESPLAKLPEVPRVPAGEITIALGAVTCLFTVFVAVQARWLFNGAEALGAIPGLTAADYARRGFFELVTAAALTLPLLLVADAVTREAPARLRRNLRLLSVSMVLLVLLIMGSALQRMGLYTARFGLTESRLYATAFMGWLGVVFAWYVITTLRGRQQRFSAGPIAAGMAAMFALAVVNPDALIARVNLDRARDGAEVDATYLARLSADAAPELLRRLDAVPADGRCPIARKLLSYTKSPAPDWRAANLAMVRARALVEGNAGLLTRIHEQECSRPANSGTAAAR